MKRHGASVVLGLLLLAGIAAVSGCPFKSWDPYPEDVPTDAISGGSPTSGGAGPRCGDGHKDPGEDCDFGSDMPHDGCNADCKQEACWTCTTMGGSCTTVAPGLAGSCDQGQFCDSQNKCAPCVPRDEASPACGTLSGTECTADTDCASKQCMLGICRRNEGEICNDDVQCATNRCDSSTGLCAQCDSGAHCKSNECDTSTHTCKAALGEPCEDPAACSSETKCTDARLCLFDINHGCSGDIECSSKFCKLGTCQSCTNQTCNNNAQCFAGTCVIGFPPTYYCIGDTDCQSQNCDDEFPRKCQ
jgi:cysteine-rich repeat protein